MQLVGALSVLSIILYAFDFIKTSGVVGCIAFLIFVFFSLFILNIKKTALSFTILTIITSTFLPKYIDIIFRTGISFSLIFLCAGLFMIALMLFLPTAAVCSGIFQFSQISFSKITLFQNMKRSKFISLIFLCRVLGTLLAFFVFYNFSNRYHYTTFERFVLLCVFILEIILYLVQAFAAVARINNANLKSWLKVVAFIPKINILLYIFLFFPKPAPKIYVDENNQEYIDVDID